MCINFYKYARSDYDIACLVKEYCTNHDLDPGRCWHLQQAIEKMLKLLIGTLGGSYAKTSNIYTLYNQYLKLGGCEIPNMGSCATIVSEWYISARYDAINIAVTEDMFNKVERIYLRLCDVYQELTTFNSEEFLKNYYREKYSLLPMSSIKACKTEEDCLKLIDQLKGVINN